jgi:hypothetical protein
VIGDAKDALDFDPEKIRENYDHGRRIGAALPYGGQTMTRDEVKRRLYPILSNTFNIPAENIREEDALADLGDYHDAREGLLLAHIRQAFEPHPVTITPDKINGNTLVRTLVDMILKEDAIIEKRYLCYGTDKEDLTLKVLAAKSDEQPTTVYHISLFTLRSTKRKWRAVVTCSQGHENVFTGED